MLRERFRIELDCELLGAFVKRLRVPIRICEDEMDSCSLKSAIYPIHLYDISNLIINVNYWLHWYEFRNSQWKYMPISVEVNCLKEMMVKMLAWIATCLQRRSGPDYLLSAKYVVKYSCGEVDPGTSG